MAIEKPLARPGITPDSQEAEPSLLGALRISRAMDELKSSLAEGNREAGPPGTSEWLSRLNSSRITLEFQETSSLQFGRRDSNSPLLIAHLDRLAGLQQIRTHYLSSTNEHAWIYVPRLNLWIDDTTEISEYGVCSDTFLRVALLDEFGEIEVFHTHPDGLYENLHKQGHLPDTFLTIAATPSEGDPLTATSLENLARPDAWLKSHIISHYGVTSYCRTAQFRFDDDVRAQPFRWDLSSIRKDSPACEEITRICADLERAVAFVQADGRVIPTWKIAFMPFS